MLNNHLSLKYLYLLIVSFFCFNNYSQNKPQISGQIQLNHNIWNSTAYLSYIPTFDDMYKISGDMIITAVEIDSTGHFMFNTSFLPEENNLYRIHISKKNAPPVSLIIGSEEENHIFFIANKTSNISFKNEHKNNLFNDVLFHKDTINSDFQNVTRIIKNEENIDFNATLIQRKFIKESTQKQLKIIAKENPHPLVSLYALYKSELDNNKVNDQKLIKAFDNKWHSEDDPYFNAYRNTYIIQTSNDNYLVFLTIGLFILVIGYVLIHVFKNKKNTNNKKQLQSLSIQERKILTLLQKGKSNKEISEECHIGLSTVKSHVSSIYSKLNVKSRKEVVAITLS